MRIKRLLREIGQILLSAFFILMGLSLFLTHDPIPGTDRSTTAIIGLLLIGIGGALHKIGMIRGDERVRQRVRRER